jgi:membrane fusion protein (multidrug efflux system)
MRASPTTAFAFAAAIAAAGCRRSHEEGEPAEGPKKVRCAEVVAHHFSDQIELRGTVAPLPDRDAQVAAQVAGRILHVLVREGDRVTSGQVVARIDDAPLLDQAQEADAVLAKARAERKNAETTAARVQRVFDHGIAARQEVDDANARAEAATAAEAEAAASAQRSHRQLDRATVRSPLGGVVLKVLHRSGELVDGTPSTPIVEVGDPSQLELVSEAPAQDLVRVPRGAVAAVVLAALPGRSFRGKVVAVAPAVDRATGLGNIRIALDLAGGPAPPVGVFGTARITGGAPREGTAVPAAALRSAIGNEAELVACGTDQVAHVLKVKRGQTADGVVEVVAGELKPGDRVAVDPVLGLVDGDRLEIAR